MNKDRTGSLIFGISFLIATVFIVAVIALQPTPIDAVSLQQAHGITPEENLARKKEWIKSTQESILRGQTSYQLNCAFCHEQKGVNLLDQFKTGRLHVGGTELDIFKVISHGIPERGMSRMDHLMENERWDIVHYLRSLNPTLPSSSQSDFERYFNEGI